MVFLGLVTIHWNLARAQHSTTWKLYNCRNIRMQIEYGYFKHQTCSVVQLQLKSVYVLLLRFFLAICLPWKITSKNLSLSKFMQNIGKRQRKNNAFQWWCQFLLASLLHTRKFWRAYYWLKKVKIGSLSAPTIDATVVCFVFVCWFRFSFRLFRVCCIFDCLPRAKCYKRREKLTSTDCFVFFLSFFLLRTDQMKLNCACSLRS